MNGLSSSRINRFFKFLSYAETRHALRRNLQRLVGFRIPSNARPSLTRFESAKTDESNSLAASHSLNNRFHHYVDDRFGILLGCAGFSCDNIDQFSFIQFASTPRFTARSRDSMFNPFRLLLSLTSRKLVRKHIIVCQQSHVNVPHTSHMRNATSDAISHALR
jgi:hypothetical protein